MRTTGLEMSLRLFARIGLLCTALGLLVVAPTAISAQDSPVVPDREQLREYTIAHLAINDARDEFHGKLARVHDAEGRLRAREEVESSIETTLEEHELTRERYDEITLMISLDGALRTMFEEIVLELEEEG